MKPTDYLQEPYRWVFIYDKKADGWTGFIEEFPGCIAEGDSFLSVSLNLNRVASSWIAAALSMGQTIPEPKFKERPNSF